jgi:hypothetical protein
MSETAEAAADQTVPYPAPEQSYSEYPVQDYQAPAAPRTFMQRLMANKIMFFGLIGIIAVVVIAAAVMAGGGGAVFGGGKAPPAPMKMVPLDSSYDLKGDQVPEKQTKEYPISFGDANDSEVSNVYEVSAACSWSDDYSGSEPDSMTFELVSPAGKNMSSTSEGSSGNAQLTVKDENVTDKKMVDNTQGWVLRVTCNFAGHKDVGPLGFLIYVDAGNNFNAKITYKYYGHEGAAKTNSTK